MENLSVCPSEMLIELQTLLRMPVDKILQFSEIFVGCLMKVLDSRVPRKILDLIKKVWIRLHSISPRR